MKRPLSLRGGFVPAVLLASCLSPLHAQQRVREQYIPEPPRQVQPSQYPPSPPPPLAPQSVPGTIPAVELNDPVLLAKNGDEALANGQWQQAAANYNGLLLIGKKTGVKQEELESLHCAVGFCLCQLKKDDEALVWLMEYQDLYPAGKWIDLVKLETAHVFAAQKQWAQAIYYYKPLSDRSFLRDEALAGLFNAYEQNQMQARVISTLDRNLAFEIKSVWEVQSTIRLIDLQTSRPDRALQWLDKLQTTPLSRGYTVQINAAAMKLAAMFMQMERYPEALRVWQSVRLKGETLSYLKKRLTACDREMAGLPLPAKPVAGDMLSELRKGRKAPELLSIRQLARAVADQAEVQALVTTLEKEPHYDAVVLYQTGRCLARLGRYEEAVKELNDVYTNYPKFDERPNVLYALGFCSYHLVPGEPAKEDLKQLEAADALLVEFLAKHGKTAEASSVAQMRLELATRTKDAARLEKVKGEVKDLLPK